MYITASSVDILQFKYDQAALLYFMNWFWGIHGYEGNA